MAQEQVVRRLPPRGDVMLQINAVSGNDVTPEAITCFFLPHILKILLVIFVGEGNKLRIAFPNQTIGSCDYKCHWPNG